MVSSYKTVINHRPSMTSSENVCLIWNDFSDNASQSIHGLRGDTDFTDVTLVGEDRRQVEAHKVILASSSPFFKEVLKEARHPHPLLYMKGVNEDTLTSLLDFIYNGEVRIEQAGLDKFLALAEELEVKGLVKDGSKKDIEDGGNQNIKNKVTRKDTEVKEEQEVLVPERNFEVDELSFIGHDDALVTPEYEDETKLNEQIMSMMEKVDSGWSCTICGKCYTTKNNTQNMKSHVENNHMEGGSWPCTDCDKVFRRRVNLKRHNKLHSKIIKV